MEKTADYVDQCVTFRFIGPVLGLANIGMDHGPCGPGGQREISLGGPRAASDRVRAGKPARAALVPGGVESRARFGRGASRGFPRHGSGQPRDADAVIVLATAGVATAVASLGAPALVKASRPRPQEAILRFGYLAPDIVEAIVEGRQPRSLTVKRLLQGIPCAWADQRTAFGLAR